MALEISLHLDFDASTDMLFMESDFEVLAMDVQEYRDNILFASFEEETKPDRNNNYHDSNTTALTEDTSLQETDGDDDDECIDTEPIPSVVPSHSPPCSEAGEGNSVDMGNAYITKPGKLDVLCGQSRSCASHFGNRRFQHVLDLYAPKYDAVTSKQEKMALTKEIVSCIRASGGRFLRKKNENQWQEIPTVTARDKVSHALRTKVASWKKQNQQQQQEKTDSTITGSLTKSAKKSTPPRGRVRSSRTQHSRQRSSSSSVNTRGSDIPTSSFDGNDPTSNNLIEDLLKTQREIFANLQKHTTNTSVNQNDHPLIRSSR